MKSLFSVIAIIICLAFNHTKAHAQQPVLQLFTLEKVKLTVNDGMNTFEVKSTTHLSEGWKVIPFGRCFVKIEASEPLALLIQTTNYKGEVNRLFDRKAKKVWEFELNPLEGDTFSITPFTETTKCLTCGK